LPLPDRFGRSEDDRRSADGRLRQERCISLLTPKTFHDERAPEQSGAFFHGRGGKKD
jgi:hypothetical protein